MNPGTRRMPFDAPTDGGIYKVVFVHENDFVDIEDVDGNGVIHHNVDPARIRIIKNP